MLKWASINMKLGKAVILSKSLLHRELGQKGYLKHIKMVWPVKQGHNLGAQTSRDEKGEEYFHTCSTYDYRPYIKNLVSWLVEQGDAAIAEFKNGLRAILNEASMDLWWFWMEIKKIINAKYTAVLRKATDVLKSILLTRSEKVTTIHTYNNIADSAGPSDSASPLACGTGRRESEKPKAKRKMSRKKRRATFELLVANNTRFNGLI
jgi:hypothetical protein